MRNGFSLVEVIISVLIISIVGFALLQMQSTTLKSLSLIETRLEVNEFSSLIFGKVTKDLHEKKRTAYEYIQDRYTIDSDDLIRYLKEREYEYTQEELYFLHFGDNEEESDEESLIMESRDSFTDKEATDDVKQEGVLIETVRIKDDNNNSTSLYHFSFIK